MNAQTKGSLIVLASSLFFGSYGIWAKLIGDSLDNFVQIWARSLIIVAILLPIGLLTKSLRWVDHKDWKWMAIFTLFGSCAVAPFFYAVNTIGVGPSTLLFYASYTIISYVLGILFFKEKLTIGKIVSLLLALAGLGLLFDLSFKSGLILGAIWAIVAGSGGGIEVVFTKKISGKYSALQITLLLWIVIFLTHFVLSLFLLSPLPQLGLSPSWLAVIAYALTSIGAFYLVTVGYKYVEPSIGSIIGLMEIIFGLAFGMIFFSEPLTLQITLGGVAIILAALIPNVPDLLRKLAYNKSQS